MAVTVRPAGTFPANDPYQGAMALWTPPVDVRTQYPPVTRSAASAVTGGYLKFLAGRCRPNTVLAVAYDLKVFFTEVGKLPVPSMGWFAHFLDPEGNTIGLLQPDANAAADQA